VKQRVLGGSHARRKRNFEEELEENMRELVREGLGIEVGGGLFSG
jgi:aarF domain-containing kinase